MEPSTTRPEARLRSVATRTTRCRRASSRPRQRAANFQGKGGFPAVGERLATFTNATTGYNEAVANLVDCKHFSGTSGGEKVTGGTVEQMSFPHYGNASDAFVVIFTISGMRFYQDLLYVRKGSIVMAFFEGNLRSVNVSQFQGFVKKAVAKLP